MSAGRSRITIVDYGVGNLLSARRAFEHVGCEVILASSPEQCLAAEKLVLPGVGAFGDCVRQLAARRLLEPIRRFAQGGRPLLGICVGMQMLFDVSEEFGQHEGLGLLPGRVVELPSHHRHTGAPLRVPQVGWARIEPGPGMDACPRSLLPETVLHKDVYFVHSFAAEPELDADRLAVYRHGEHAVCAAVQRDNIMGTQFHPEKSGPVGLSIIRRFSELN